jgi:hypothetical protein
MIVYSIALSLFTIVANGTGKQAFAFGACHCKWRLPDVELNLPSGR